MKIYKVVIITVFLVFGFAMNSSSQEVRKNNDAFQVVDEMPEFPGGEDAVRSFLAEKVVYPKEAVKDSITGKVFCSFIVDENGKVIEPKIERSVNPLLDKESLRVVSLLPDWTPGKEDGKAVKVQFTVPVNFELK